MDIVNKPAPGDPDAVTAPLEDAIPDNLQGKSPAELAKMYQSLERKLGEQSNELGQLRTVAQQAIAQPQAQQQVEELDFYAEPEKAVEQLLAQKLEPLQAALNDYRQRRVTEKLDADYPNWKETVKDAKFQDWVAGSKVRVNLFQQANTADLEAATELLSTWAGISANSQQTEQATQAAVKRDRQLRAATTEKGAASIDNRKTLSRTDLQELKRQNPNEYRRLLPEIKKAYLEKRVRP